MWTLLSFSPFMEPQGAAENAGPGRSNKLGLCESDRGNKFKRQDPTGNTLRSCSKRQIGSAGPSTPKGERQQNHPELVEGEGRNLKECFSVGLHCQQWQLLTWKAMNTSGCFPAPLQVCPSTCTKLSQILAPQSVRANEVPQTPWETAEQSQQTVLKQMYHIHVSKKLFKLKNKKSERVSK